MTRRAPPDPSTSNLPILLYHRVLPTADGSYSVSREHFAAQLRYLKETGYRTIRLDEWADAKRRHQPIPGRSIVLTFDDGDRDFYLHAWPLLREHGFLALVFLVTDLVGGKSEWMKPWRTTIPLMNWQEIAQLRREGVEFGSHTATHPYLTALPAAEIVEELARSRAALARMGPRSAGAIAYPFGDEDPVVRHLAGACGYLYGLSCRPGPAPLSAPLLSLPRIEITQEDDLGEFVRKLDAV